MTTGEIQQKIVDKGMSRKGKNKYTQGEKRTLVGSGYSDCSSFVRWCYLQILGTDIGGNTAAQINNKNLITTHSGGKYPDVKMLQLGDLIYFKGNKSNPKGVGHVEMVVKVGKTLGDCQLLGHGSGTGPTLKNAKTYLDSRYASGKGYIETRRAKVIGIKTYELGDRELKKGCEGADVKQMQSALIGLKFSCGKYGADGDFGGDTESAVKKFQKAYKLDVDGIFGKKSYAKLKGLLDQTDTSVPDTAPLTDVDDPDTEDADWIDSDSDAATDEVAGDAAQEPSAPDDFDTPPEDADASMGATAQNPYPVSTKDLYQGSKGKGVQWAQWELCESGYDIGKYGIDGDFGPDTDKAVRKFQKDHKLAVDGIVGKNTRAALIGEVPSSTNRTSVQSETDIGPGTGIYDLSHHDGKINWGKAAPKFALAILRVQDNNVADTQFANNVKGCEANGVPYGTYAFFRAGSVTAAKTEAERYWNRQKAVAKNTRFMCVDVETKTAKTWEEVDAAVMAYINRLCELSCLPVWAYVGNHIAANLPKTCKYAWEHTVLWKPRYNKWVTPPYANWHLWQGGASTLPGISSRVDTNRVKSGLSVQWLLGRGR